LKNNVCFLLYIFLALCANSYASGKAQTPTVIRTTQNDKWVLCITNFDARSLPSDRVNISETVLRELAGKMKAIDYRTRISPEYAYYEEYAWSRERTRAASALASKYTERAALIYRGDADWRYRQNIAGIDAEINTLLKRLNEIENNAPLINNEPVFSLSNSNLNNTFPAAPSAGGEYRFCTSQGSDAFLSGSIIDFYGRYFLTVKLYVVFARSYIWEDSIIFSNDDIEGAVLELSRKLLIVLSGNTPAQVTVKAEPEETLLLINGSFAGRGEITQTDFPPGLMNVIASAPNHESLTFQTRLLPGENVDININLNAFKFGDVDVFTNNPGSIYHGAMYMGESPLTISLPINSMEYFEFEGYDSTRATLAFNTPYSPDFTFPVTMNSIIPIEKGRVEKDRTAFYWAYGGIWITGMSAWIASYTLQSARAGSVNTGLYMGLSIGSIVVVGTVAVYGIYRLIRYLYNSSRDVTPVLNTYGESFVSFNDASAVNEEYSGIYDDAPGDYGELLDETLYEERD